MRKSNILRVKIHSHKPKKNHSHKPKRNKYKSARRYSGAFGDGCGIGASVIDDNKAGACYKNCDLTEISHDLYCEHVGLFPGEKYTHKTSDQKLDNYFRQREYSPRDSDRMIGDRKSEREKNDVLYNKLVKDNKWERYDINNSIVNKAVNAVTGAATAVVKGAAGLIVDGAVCLGSTLDPNRSALCTTYNARNGIKNSK